MEFLNLYEWVQTVTPDMLPAAPFAASDGVTVLDSGLWLESVQAEARCGPAGPRAKYGAIQADMRRIYELTTIPGSG